MPVNRLYAQVLCVYFQTVSSAFPTNYSSNSPSKMAVMFQSHHNNKMASMFYQVRHFQSSSRALVSDHDNRSRGGTEL